MTAQCSCWTELDRGRSTYSVSLLNQGVNTYPILTPFQGNEVTTSTAIILNDKILLQKRHIDFSALGKDSTGAIRSGGVGVSERAVAQLSCSTRLHWLPVLASIGGDAAGVGVAVVGEFDVLDEVAGGDGAGEGEDGEGG